MELRDYELMEEAEMVIFTISLDPPKNRRLEYIAKRMKIKKQN